MMNQNHVASAYRQVGARGATPVGLIVKLYDAVIEDLRHAHDAIVAKDIARRTSRFNHALLIIGELEGVLDHERGGIVAKRLKGFYQVTRGMMMEASTRGNREMTEKLMELYVPMRQAWQQVDLDVSSGKTRMPELSDVPALEAAGVTRTLQPVGVGADSESEGSEWSA